MGTKRAGARRRSVLPENVAGRSEAARLFGFWLCALFAGAVSAGSVQAGSVEGWQRATWAETMHACREEMDGAQAAVRGRAAFSSEVIRCGEEPVQVTADVSGFENLWLMASDAGDGIAQDHAVWGDAELIGADGARTSLSTLAPISVTTGWNDLQRDRDFNGEALVLGGRRFEKGLFAHANSAVCYELGGRYQRFEAWVGICDTAEAPGSVCFTVTDRCDGLAAMWGEIERLWPSLANHFREDAGGEHLTWFRQAGDERTCADIEKHVATEALDRLGDSSEAGDLRQEFEGMLQARIRGNDPRWLGFYEKVCDLKRKPMVERCPPVVFVKRKHFRRPFGIGSIIGWDIHEPGCGIYVYDPAEAEKGARAVFLPEDGERFERGVIYDISLSFDARKLLFAWRECTPDDSFSIYEIGLDGSGLRQLTDGRYHDVHPFYLPDGRIGFVSTRVQGYTLCQPGAASALYTMNADGGDMRRIHFGTLSDHSPYVMDDGRILFTRWEYQDKSLTYAQGLWRVNPDGTRLDLFFGNTILEPAVTWQAKTIPGTFEVLCTLAPHHGNPVGAVGIIDRSVGLENPLAIHNLTDEIPYQPQLNRRGPGDACYYWSYRDPWPLDTNLFLAAYGGPDPGGPLGGPGRYRLILLDRDGHSEVLYYDPSISCFNPLPLVPRSEPHRFSEPPAALPGEGAFFVADVYQGLAGIERGAVKAIRVMRVLPKPCNMRGRRAYDMDPLMSRATYYAKECLGTAPVDEFGSAFFKAPSGGEIYFQAVDAEGKEVCRMGTVTQIMPGEVQSCVGCHESRFSTPPRERVDHKAYAEALRRGAAALTPPPWGSGAIDFVRHVQPVFDRYCVKCHSGPRPGAALDLSGDKTRCFSMAYDSLVDRQLVHHIYLLGAPNDVFLPMQTGSHVSRLAEIIDGEHQGVEVDEESRRRVFIWIDANAPYYSTYEHTRPGTPGSRDIFQSKPGEYAAWLREFSRTYEPHCQSCHAPFEASPEAHRNATWINLTHPEWSKVLMAPLSKDAGGLGKCKEIDGRQPACFESKSDPRYVAMLAALRKGKAALEAKPRVDMEGAEPEPYPVDFGKLFSGFAGP